MRVSKLRIDVYGVSRTSVSSSSQLLDVEEVALAEEELGLLAFPCHRSANPVHGTPVGVSTAGPAAAITGPRGADEIKRSGQLLDEAVGANEPASGKVGAAPGPVGSSNIWARSEGSGSGATGVAVDAVGGAVGALKGTRARALFATKETGTVGATPLSAAPGLVTSWSATDWLVELDGGPGGSDAVGALARDMDRLAGSEPCSDVESSDGVCTVICTR